MYGNYFYLLMEKSFITWSIFELEKYYLHQNLSELLVKFNGMFSLSAVLKC